MTETSFLEAVRADDTVKGPSCSIATLLASVPFADDLRAALADQSIKHSAIYRNLIKRGYKVDPNTISRHRRHICRCES